MIKKIVMFSVLTMSFLIIPFKVNASSAPYMITANPGEDASSQMGISWHTDTSVTKGKVIYTKKGDTNWDDAITITARYDLITVFYDGDIHHFTAEIDGLEAVTDYKYKVGDDVLSEEYYFKTGGSDEFNFIWVSDWHAWRGSKRRVDSVTKVINNMRILEPDIDFIVSTGDDNTYGSDYLAYKYTHEQQQYQDFYWASTVGNHDVMNSNASTQAKLGPNSDDFFIATHNLPKNGYEGQEGASYFFKNGPMLFIVLNNEDINKSKSTRLPGIQAWVKKVIDENPAQYVMVMMHYQWFDGRTGATNAQYTDWRKFFDENKVDFAMSGNNHVYLRTDRVYDDEPTGTTKGTVYLQAPSSDGERGVVIKEHTRNTHIINKIWSQGTSTIGGIIVKVTKEKLEITLVNDRAERVDTASFLSRYHDYEFDKESFLNSIEIKTHDGKNLITADIEGLKFVERINYYQDGTLIDVNQFHHVSHLAYELKGLTSLNSITAEVKYYDGETDLVELYNDRYYNLENVEITLKSGNPELSWDYDLIDDFSLYIFKDDVFYKQVNARDKKVVLNDFDLTKSVIIKPLRNTDIEYYNVKYNIYGDLNLDGIVNINDVQLMLNYSFNYPFDNVNPYHDINGDGKVSLVDLTYLHLYANKVIDSVILETYEVNFYDLDDRLIETQFVRRGSDAVFPLMEINQGIYKVIGFDKSLKNISSNLDVRPVVIYVGEKQ